MRKYLLLWASTMHITLGEEIHLLVFAFKNVSSQRLSCCGLLSSILAREKEGTLIWYWSPSKQTKAKPMAGYNKAGQCLCSTCDYICTLTLPHFGMSFCSTNDATEAREVLTVRYESTRAKGFESNPTAPQTIFKVLGRALVDVFLFAFLSLVKEVTN